MNSIQFGQPLGIQGVEDRVAQLSNMLGIESTPSPSASPAFNDALQGALGNNGFAPVNPGHGNTSIEPADIKSMIQSSALANGVDPHLFDALVQQESGYNPNSRSRAGAMGLTQLMPETASSLGVTSPFDPVQNLQGGAKYLKSLLNQFNSVPLALAAYNAGPAAVIRHGGIPPYHETQNYVNSILAKYEGRQSP